MIRDFINEIKLINSMKQKTLIVILLIITLPFSNNISFGQTINDAKNKHDDNVFAKNGLLFSKNTDSISVSLCGAINSLFGLVRIPSFVEDESGKVFYVSEIGNENNASVFGDDIEISKIVISDGIKRIRPYSFADCHKLQAVVIPASVEIIDSYAFYNCENLENITIEGNPIVKSSTSFLNTAWMKKQSAGALILAGNLIWYKGGTPRNYVIPEGVFNICADAFQNGFFSNIVVSEGVKFIQPNAFYATKTIKLPSTIESLPLNIYVNPESNSQIDSIFIPCNVNELLLVNSEGKYGSFRFRKMSVDPANRNYFSPYNSEIIIRKTDSTLIIAGISDTIIPMGVQTIGEYAFAYHDITSVVIPNSVQYISESAFQGCLQLSKVTMSDSLLLIGDNAFNSCIKLVDFTWPDQLIQIGANSFFASGIENASLPESIISIGSNAFAASSLKSLTLSDSLKYLGDYAFSNTLITEIEIPSDLYRIGNGVFSNCSKLKSIIIPGNIEEVGKYAFSGCSFLEKVIIEDGVKIINEHAFEGCACLDDIYNYSAEPQFVFDSSFSNYRTLHVKKKSKHSYISTRIWNCFSIKEDL